MDFLFSIEYIPIRERDRGQRGYGAKYPTDRPLVRTCSTPNCRRRSANPSRQSEPASSRRLAHELIPAVDVCGCIVCIGGCNRDSRCSGFDLVDVARQTLGGDVPPEQRLCSNNGQIDISGLGESYQAGKLL